MSNIVTVTGLQELIKRMKRFPAQMMRIGNVAMRASLNILWSNVPPYPQKRNPESKYKRTGTLGRTLGSDEGGGKLGEPDIFTVHRLSSNYLEGKFGTRLDHAEHVIGEGTQAEIHRGWWWTMKTIFEASRARIFSTWQAVADELARFLDGR